MYFNDDFDGGELVYPEYKLMYKPKKGDIVFHNIDTIHAVNEVLSDSDRISFQGSIAHYRWINSDFLESVYSKINNNEYEGGSNDFFIHQLPIHNKRLKKFAEENSHLVKDWHPKSNKIFRLEY
jgi:hypothetical protein